MGVNLSPIVTAREIELEELRGKTVAVDAYNTIFQFLSIIRQPDGKPLMDAEGRVTSHLSGLLYRTANLIEAGIEPSFVFDGKPNELKAGTIEERIARREKAKQEYEEELNIEYYRECLETYPYPVGTKVRIRFRKPYDAEIVEAILGRPEKKDYNGKWNMAFKQIKKDGTPSLRSFDIDVDSISSIEAID